MSLINKFKSLLPISSRSFHAAEKHFVAQNNLVKDELFDINRSKMSSFAASSKQTTGLMEILMQNTMPSTPP